MDQIPDAATLVREVSAIAREAGDVLRKYFDSKTFSLRQKEGVDFTTEADIKADEIIQRGLTKKFPYPLLTEETAPADYRHMEDEKYLWVIDPLDGTINFSRGCANFAVSIALLRKGKPVFGLVYTPIDDELFWAHEEVAQAFLNGKPIEVSKTNEAREFVVACDWAWGLERRREVVRCLDRICGEVRQIKSMGSAVADLALLAGGGIDAYLHAGLKPWDTAAAVLLIKKAGGIVTDLQGNPWNPFIDNILAGNPVVHGKILALIERDPSSQQ